MHKLLNTLLVAFLFLHISCRNNDVEIPEYATHDWYAHYIIDGEEHTIVKDGTDNTEPYLGSYESFGADLNPDGSIKEVTFVYLTTDLQTTSVETDSVMWFGYDIITPDKALIATRGKSRGERLNALVTYFTNKQYINNEYTASTLVEYVNLRIADKYGKTYNNELLGGIFIKHYYTIEVKKVEIVEHSELGRVVKVLMHFNASIEDTIYGQFHQLEAEVQTFFLPPFED